LVGCLEDVVAGKAYPGFLCTLKEGLFH
jgi:hypothetical protein